MERLTNCVPVLFIICGYAVSLYWMRRYRIESLTIRDIIMVNIISVSFAIIAISISIIVAISVELGS